MARTPIDWKNPKPQPQRREVYIDEGETTRPRLGFGGLGVKKLDYSLGVRLGQGAMGSTWCEGSNAEGSP